MNASMCVRAQLFSRTGRINVAKMGASSSPLHIPITGNAAFKLNIAVLGFLNALKCVNLFYNINFN